MPDFSVYALLAVPLATTWAGRQSALHPKADQASLGADIGWVMFAGGSGIFLLVMVILVLALVGPQRWRRHLSGRAWLIGAGVAFPVVVLSALLVYSLGLAASMVRTDAPAAVRIEVMGEMWWWRVRYLDEQGQVLFETANDIRIPVGQPVDLMLTSRNVVHSFWVPNLAGKLDMVPGHVNRLRIQAREAGSFRGQCAEFCGAQHAQMMFDVQVLAPADFQAWLQAQQQPAQAPADAQLRQGRQLFTQACAQCHTVRGTQAAGTLGPDLTHVGSRLSLAAGVLPNNVGSLAGWIAGSQHIKPGNAMPSFNQLSGEQLRAVAHYMESLQ
ncbi:cytochrome c oxidase subunit II [Bordetella sp. BOR01]|uniref:cytochrome c oxidase subunit II n=1 Tax=Bordetella sp. BOR01 TaxID=2854779 RepID=UPI001C48F834|nr:cytochrome c oxidase subunit II [Bordetella sp. BOR01]MBV7486859.1 c-type cytochrome [Bordetella sp. BOR01]